MDDPWGSPWTSSDHSNGFGDGNATGSTTVGLNGGGDGGTPKPPRPAVLAGGLSGNTPFASLPEASPWADEDDGHSGFGGFDDDNAFGDWATATADTNTSLGGGGLSTPGTSGWGGFAGDEGFENGFGTTGSNNTHLSPRKDSKTAYGGLGQLSPIAWPSSAALSPGGSPGGSPRRRRALSRQSSVNSLGSAKGVGGIGRSRSPSIDPWSSFSAPPNEKHDDTEQKPDYTRTRASSTLSIPILRLDESNTSKPHEDEAKPADKATAELPKDVPVPQIVAEHVDSEDSTDSDNEENDETPKPPPQPTFPPISSSSSRPSSSGSDGSRSTSHHADIDDPIKDSPTTSVEDDATAHAADGSTAATDANTLNADTDTGTISTTPRAHVVQRKSSSKVQGLVELYDGLSTRRAAVRSVSASSSARDSSRHGSIMSDRSVDTSEIMEDNEAEPTPKAALFVETPIKTTGPEFPTSDLSKEATKDATEDGTENDDDESSDDGSEADPETAKAITSYATYKKEDDANEPPQTPRAGTELKEEAKAAPAPDTDILSASRLLALYGKQTYTIDQAKIDELYNDKDVKVRPRPKKAVDDEHSSTKPPLDAFIPDYILDDSFTTISERKVWYRIARHGSYRKHAAGGDDNDNYRPVTWRTSRIRDDTVKIVRRWMEEDSFTGKPTLGGGFGRGLGGGVGGGGGRSGNLFGWDSAAEPVALDEVFKKKRPTNAPPGAGHKYNLSATSSAWANEGSGASAGIPSPAGFSGEFSPGFSPAPVFGWGSGGGHSHDKLESARNSVQFERPAPPPQPVAAPSPVVAVPSPTVPQPSRFSVVLPPRDIAPSLAPSTEKEDTGAFADGDDDDDDWGEMISSPVKEEFSIPPMTAMSLPPAPVEVVPAFVAAPAPAPVQIKPSIPVQTPTPPPQLDDRAVSSVADSIIRGLPDLSYMAA